MISNILSYVPKRDMVHNVVKTSQKLKFVAVAPSVWRHVYLGGFKPVVTYLMVKAMNENASLIQSLRIKSYDTFKDRAAFVGALTKMVNLTKFFSPNWSFLTNFGFLKNMPKLETLDISYCYFISSATLSAALMFCPDLQNLNICGNVQFETKHIVKILMNHPKLVWANVMGSTLLESDDTYYCLLPMLRIKVLALTPACPVTETEAWTILFRRFPSVHVSAAMAKTLKLTKMDESVIRVWCDAITFKAT